MLHISNTFFTFYFNISGKTEDIRVIHLLPLSNAGYLTHFRAAPTAPKGLLSDPKKMSHKPAHSQEDSLTHENNKNM